MSQIQAYERDPYLRQLDARVVATGDDDGRPWAVLDDTLFFPEGGGQPSDRGFLGGVRVEDVGRHGGEIRHFLDAPAAPGPVRLELDWARRFDHMQQHTAQHLLTAIALDGLGWRTTAFHLRLEVCDVELDVPAIQDADLEALEEAVAAEIRADHPVTARRVTPEEYQGLAVRSRGLPAGHSGDVRLVEIEGIDLNTCGGTHLHRTGEIETLKLLATESIRGGTRLHWLAGGRVRRRLGDHEARNAELRRVLDTGDDDLVRVVALKLEQLKDAQRRQKVLAGELAAAVAARLAGEGVASAHWDDADLGFLQEVARRFLDASPEGVALLTCGGDKGPSFVVAVGDASGLDLKAAGQRVADLLDGRGGGARGVFQGKAGSLARRDEALAALAAGT